MGKRSSAISFLYPIIKFQNYTDKQVQALSYRKESGIKEGIGGPTLSLRISLQSHSTVFPTSEST